MQKKKNRKKMDRRILIAAALAIGGLGLSIYGIRKSDEDNKMIQANAKMIAGMKADVDQLQNVETEDAVEIEKKMSSAAKQGEALAEVQNRYKSIRPENGDALERNVVQAEELLSEDGKDAKVSWYSYTDENLDPVWSFQSTYAFESDRLEVVWLCRNSKDNELMAYATGVYDSNTGKFSDVSWHMTSAGIAAIPGEKEGARSEIDDMIKKIQEAAPVDEDAANPSNEVRQEQAAARDALKESMGAD